MADLCTDPAALTQKPLSAWQERLRASTIHLVISLILAGAMAALVFGLWYPAPYREISGGRSLFLLVIFIDIVLGPLITLLVFHRGKSRRELIMDLTLIGLLQLAALVYGVWTVYAARPVHLVFEYQRLAVVHAIDIPASTLIQAPATLRTLPRTGPTLLSLRPLRASEAVESTLLALDGIPQAAQPRLWQEYDAALPQILAVAHPVAQLQARFPQAATAITQAIQASGLPSQQLLTLPLLSRETAWTALLDAGTGQPVGFLPIDSF